MKNIPLLDIHYLENPKLTHFFRIMRISIFLLFFSVFGMMAKSGHSQNARVTINQNNVQLETILDEIEGQTDYLFIYKKNVNVSARKSVNVYNKSVAEVLSVLLSDSPLTYKMEGNHIFLVEKTKQEINQNRINGIVTDASGEPLVGVTILVKGGSQGTVTNLDGKFSVAANVDDVLVVSYVGYVSQEVRLKSTKLLQITIMEDVKLLDEVVVVGYGTQKKSDLTGSVAVVSSEKLMNMPASNIADALVGKIPGALIQNAGGSNPSGGTTIQIRGVASLNGSANSPLFVVDGIPLFDANLNTVDPETIESINVLKDASSTAIYGARAAAGVIIVTTKKGKEGKGRIHISIDQGVQKIAKNYNVVNAATHYRTIESGWDTWEALGINRDKTTQKMYNDYYSPILWNKELNRPTNDVDWKNSLLQNMTHWQKYSIGFSGGTQGFDYYLNFSYEDREGIMLNSDFNRLALASNVNFKVKKNFRVGISTNISYTSNSGIGGLNDRFGSYMPTVYKPQFIPMYSAEGEMIVAAKEFKANQDYALAPLQNTFAAENQLYNILTQTNSGHTQRVLNNAYLEYEPIKGLVFKTNFGFELLARNTKNIQYLQEKKYLEIGNASQRDLVSTSSAFNQKRNWVANETVTYNFGIKKHSFNLTGVFEMQENYGEFLNLTARGSTDNDLDQISNQPKDDVLSENGLIMNPRNFSGGPEGRIRLVSFMGRLNYSYDDRYLLTATVRRDGSSKFARGNQWGTFPSIALSWKMHNEIFWEKLPEQLTSAKLRISYGMTGNQRPVGSFQYLSNIGMGTGNWGMTYAPSNLANTDLSWETLKQLNVGIDLALFNNRLQWAFDYYYKESKDMLASVPLTVSSGFGSAIGNMGSISNKGIEVSLNTINIHTRNFKWTTDLTLSHNKNKIKDLGVEADGSKIDDVISDRYIRRVGGPVSNLYLYEIEGVWQLDSEEKPWGPQGFNDYGLFKIKDQNKDSKIDKEDRVVKGSPEPKVSGGITNTFVYKNFSLNIVCTYMLGNKLYNVPKAYLQYGHPLFNTDEDFAAKHWTPENPTNEYERSSSQRNNVGHMSSDGISLSSNKWLENADFFKIANIGFTYRLPLKITNRIGVTNMQIGVSVSNVAIFTKYSGLSPETDGGLVTGGNPTVRGVDNGGYPEARTFQANLKVNF